MLALAVGPASVLVHVIWCVDRHREPLRRVLLYLLIGALACGPAIILELMFQGGYAALAGTPAEAGLAGLLALNLVGAGFIEELVKLGGLYVFARRDRHVDEPFDWIVYAVTVALGFAAVENILYVSQHGVGTGIARAFTAVPGHALNGTVMGYRLGRASNMRGSDARSQRWLALIEPTLWHGFYDFLIAARGSSEDGGWLAAMASKAFLFLVILQWSRCVGYVRRMRLVPGIVPPLMYPIEAVRRLRPRNKSR